MEPSIKQDHSKRPIREVVFRVTGLGARFLPATKAAPKAALPVAGRLLIHYAVDEAREAWIEQMNFVTGCGKSAIKGHCDIACEFEKPLCEGRRKGHAFCYGRRVVARHESDLGVLNVGLQFWSLRRGLRCA